MILKNLKNGLLMENKKAPHHHSIEQVKKNRKDTYFQDEKQRFLKFLERNTATCSMASKATGIPHKNLCRYKQMLFDEGLIVELFKTKCRVTGRPANYLTANPGFIATLKNRTHAGHRQSNTTEEGSN